MTVHFKLDANQVEDWLASQHNCRSLLHIVACYPRHVAWMQNPKRLRCVVVACIPCLSFFGLPTCTTPQWHLQPRKFETGCGTACWPLVWRRMLWHRVMSCQRVKLLWPRQLLHSMARGLFVGYGALEEEMFPECPYRFMQKCKAYMDTIGYEYTITLDKMSIGKLLSSHISTK